MGSYPFFRLEKIGVSIVQGRQKKILQSCHKDIIKILNNKNIKTLKGD